MSINNTDSQHLLLVRAAPAFLHILDVIEELLNDPELITALRSLARDGAQQTPIEFQARSTDIPAHEQKTEAGTHPRRRNMRPCGTCSSIKVKCKIVSRVGTRRLCQRCKDKGFDECPPYEAWKGRRNHSRRASVSSSVSASASSSAPIPVNDVYQNPMSNALPPPVTPWPIVTGFQNVTFHVPSSQMSSIVPSPPSPLYTTDGLDLFSGNTDPSSQSHNYHYFLTDNQAPIYDGVHQNF